MVCVKVKFATEKDADFFIQKKARTQHVEIDEKAPNHAWQQIEETVTKKLKEHILKNHY